MRLYVLSYLINGLTGGEWTQTFCSRIAANEISGAPPRVVWRHLRIVIDQVASPIERDHCDCSLIRHLRSRATFK